VYLNKWGQWKKRNSTSLLNHIYENIRRNGILEDQIKQCHLDSIVIEHEGSNLTIQVTPYGGGYSQMIMPPVQIKIGITDEQIQGCSQLFLTLNKLIQDLVD